MAFDKQITALTVYCEASGALPEERLAVLHSIYNRLLDGRFGKTLAEVCLRRYQYSEWNDDTQDNKNLIRGARVLDNDPVLLDILRMYDDIHENDPTTGATHYHDKSISAPNWTVGAVMSLETKSFFFYKDVK